MEPPAEDSVTIIHKLKVQNDEFLNFRRRSPKSTPKKSLKIPIEIFNKRRVLWLHWVFYSFFVKSKWAYLIVLDRIENDKFD